MVLGRAPRPRVHFGRDLVLAEGSCKIWQDGRYFVKGLWCYLGGPSRTGRVRICFGNVPVQSSGEPGAGEEMLLS